MQVVFWDSKLTHSGNGIHDLKGIRSKGSCCQKTINLSIGPALCPELPLKSIVELLRRLITLLKDWFD